MESQNGGTYKVRFSYGVERKASNRSRLQNESLCLDEGREEQLAVGVELGPPTPGGCP